MAAKQHIVMDTLGLLPAVMVTSTSVADRDAGQTCRPGCASRTGASRAGGPTAAYLAPGRLRPREVPHVALTAVERTEGTSGFTLRRRDGW